jgi:hypothetical protein
VELQLKMLTACAKGLSPSPDTFHFTDPESAEGSAHIHSIERGRSALPIVQLRDAILNLLGRTMSFWSALPEIADVSKCGPLMTVFSSSPADVACISY